MHPILPTSETDRRAWYLRALTAKHLGLVAALLAVVALVLVAYNYRSYRAGRLLTARTDAVDARSESPAYRQWLEGKKNLLQLQRDIDSLPLATSAEVRAQKVKKLDDARIPFRELDQRLTAEFFAAQAGLAWGAGLLFASLVLAVFAAHIHTRFQPETPMPAPADDINKRPALLRQQGRLGLIVLILVFIGLGVWAIMRGLGNPPQIIVPQVRGPVDAEKMAVTWQSFRGPRGLAMSSVVAHLDFDAESGKNVAWKVPLPLTGYSSPIAWKRRFTDGIEEERIFVTAADADTRLVLCYNAATGEEIWRQEGIGSGKAPEVFDEMMHAAPTPVCDGEYVYATFGTGDVVALWCTNGAKEWSVSLGAPTVQYGYSQSPLLDGGTLIVPFEHGGASSGIYAFDAASGKQKWKVASPNGSSHWASPVLATIAGNKQLIVGGHGLFGLDPVTGSTIWEVKDLLHGDTAPSPAIAEGKIIACFKSSDATAVTPGKGKAWTIKEGSFPEMSSPLGLGDRFIAIDESGQATAWKAADGSVLWSKNLGAGGAASPIVMKGNVLALAADGKVSVINPADGSVVGLARTLANNGTTPLVLADGGLVVRGKSALIRHGAPGTAPTAPSLAVSVETPKVPTVKPEPKPESKPEPKNAGVTAAKMLAAVSNEWPSFRPKGQTAVDAVLPKDLSPFVTPLWKSPLQLEGYSSPAVQDGVIVTTSADETKRVVQAHDLTGKALWTHEVNDLPQPDFGGKKYAYDAPTISSATPVIGSGLVAAKFANGDLVVLDLKTGASKWGKNLGKAKDVWGNSQSPLISGKMLIVPWEHKDEGGGIHAFDLVSGEKKWSEKPNATAHWASPILAPVHGQEAILVGGWGVTALSPADGSVIWKSEPIKVVGAGMHSVSLTLLDQKHVLFCANKTPLMSFVLDAKGEQKAVWTGPSDNMPDMASPVSDGVNTWIVSNKGMLTKYNSTDGQIAGGPEKILTDPKDIIYASPMLLGDHLLVLTLNGEAIMLDAKTLKVLDRKNLGDQLAATPAVVGDLLIVRDGGSLRAVRLSVKGSTP